jgi:hypothetical protein
MTATGCGVTDDHYKATNRSVCVSAGGVKPLTTISNSLVRSTFDPTAQALQQQYFTVLLHCTLISSTTRRDNKKA